MKRRIGQSDLEVAPIALGGNVFGWTADEATSFRILDGFVDAGGTMIDSADVYSAWVPGHEGGESERVIGKWLKRDLAKRDKVVIATKVGFMAGLEPSTIAPACDASIARLGTHIDLYYQHKDDEGVPLTDSLGEFDRLKKAGKIREIGLSNFSAERVTEAIAACIAGDLALPVAVQPWYNLVERERFEGALEMVCANQGLSVFPYYSLANGFLTGKYRSKDDLGQSPRGLRSVDYLEGRGMRVLAALDDVAAESGAALATIALAWLKAKGPVTAPIASATSLEQLQQIVAALTLDLTPGQMERLDLASAD